MKAFITRVPQGGEPYTQPVVGQKVGPFCVHPRAVFNQKNFVCTHTRTGSAAFDCDDKKTALRLAKKLAQLPVSWEFDDHEHVKTFPASIKETCKKIRIEAREAVA